MYSPKVSTNRNTQSAALVAPDGPLEVPNVEPGPIYTLTEDLLIAILDVLHLSKIDAPNQIAPRSGSWFQPLHARYLLSGAISH